MLTTQSLLERATAASLKARPLESNFAVGAAVELSDLTMFVGANIEERGNTIIGTCAERAAIFNANSNSGPLSKNGGLDSRVFVEQVAVSTPTKIPITPCGICRDAIAGAGRPETVISHYRPDGSIAEMQLRDLLPLNAAAGDIAEQIEFFKSHGGEIDRSVSYDASILLSEAAKASSKSYIPPYVSELPSGAAIEMSDGSVHVGWFMADATTRLGGSAILSAARVALEASALSEVRAVRVALYSEYTVLKVPSGVDLQILQELGTEKTEIVCGCQQGAGYTTTLGALLPQPFGRKDLNY